MFVFSSYCFVILLSCCLVVLLSCLLACIALISQRLSHRKNHLRIEKHTHKIITAECAVAFIVIFLFVFSFVFSAVFISCSFFFFLLLLLVLLLLFVIFCVSCKFQPHVSFFIFIFIFLSFLLVVCFFFVYASPFCINLFCTSFCSSFSCSYTRRISWSSFFGFGMPFFFIIVKLFLRLCLCLPSHHSLHLLFLLLLLFLFLFRLALHHLLLPLLFLPRRLLLLFCRHTHHPFLPHRLSPSLFLLRLPSHFLPLLLFLYRFLPSRRHLPPPLCLYRALLLSHGFRVRMLHTNIRTYVYIQRQMQTRVWHFCSLSRVLLLHLVVCLVLSSLMHAVTATRTQTSTSRTNVQQESKGPPSLLCFFSFLFFSLDIRRDISRTTKQ